MMGPGCGQGQDTTVASVDQQCWAAAARMWVVWVVEKEDEGLREGLGL